VSFSDARQKRVLIVDDDWGIRDLLEMRLGAQGLHTRLAGNGLEALNAVRDFRPHAMILDINMPMMDGFGVMTRLGRDRMAILPTLVITARGEADDVRRALTLGAKDYLAKPFDDVALMARLRRLLRQVKG
jgi:two-component system OmpR family response regulator